MYIYMHIYIYIFFFYTYIYTYILYQKKAPSMGCSNDFRCCTGLRKDSQDNSNVSARDQFQSVL